MARRHDDHWPQEIGGETAWERAVNLAGLLAERGVTRVVLERGGARREVLARGTDLPGEIAAIEGVVRAESVEYEVRAGAITRLV